MFDKTAQAQWEILSCNEFSFVPIYNEKPIYDNMAAIKLFIFYEQSLILPTHNENTNSEFKKLFRFYFSFVSNVRVSLLHLSSYFSLRPSVYFTDTFKYC